MNDIQTQSIDAAAEAALNDEKYFGDGPPYWYEGPRNRPGKSSAEAEGERRRLVKRLRRMETSDLFTADLANRIAACRPRNRCKSGACAECSRAWQRWFVSACKHFLAHRTPSGIVTVVSPIHEAGVVARGDLSK